MKSYIKLFIISIIVGGTIAFIFYKDISNNVNAITSTDIVYLFQVGVYKNIDNAVEKKNEYIPNIIINIDEYYRVISGICYSNNSCNKLKKYFDNNSIKYYMKKYKVNTNFLKELEYYEMILNNTTNYDVIDGVNEKINNLFLSYLN